MVVESMGVEKFFPHVTRKKLHVAFFENSSEKLPILYLTHCDKIGTSIYLESVHMILKNSVLFQIAVHYNTLHYFLEPG